MNNKPQLPRYGNNQMMNYIKNLMAVLIVKFTFYLVISIIYVWLLISLGFKAEFDWNLTFLIAISLLFFSMMFEKPYPSQVKVK